jgi:hypothetical protein
MATATAQQTTQQHDANGIDLAAIMDATEQRAHESDARIDLLKLRVGNIKKAKVDAVADTRALVARAIAADNVKPQVVLEAPVGAGQLRMQIGAVAHDHLAWRLGIDKKYYQRMNEQAPELLAENLNWWLQHTPDERLLRMLRPAALTDDEQKEMAALGARVRLRGMMGKGYRTIDDADLLDAILPSLENNNAKLVDFSIDDRRMHAKFMTEFFTMDQLRALYAKATGLTVEQVRGHFKLNGKDVSWVDEPMGYGVTIRHSEVGFASLSVAFVERVAKCLNDYVSENGIAIRHTGGKDRNKALGVESDSETGDVRNTSDATQMLDNAALLSRVQDRIEREFDPKGVLERAQKLVASKVTNVERPKDVPLFEFVGGVGLSLGLGEGEIELLKEETVKSIAVEGAETHFAHVQGITALARQMTNYDRRLEVERSGFALLNDDASALVKLARDGAATTKRTRRA